MLTKLKIKIQKWLSIEAKLMHRAGFKPDTISFLGMILGVASGFSYWAAGLSLTNSNVGSYRSYLSLSLFLLLFSGFCDALDGVLARLYSGTTSLGGFLDSLIDRYVDAAIYCGLILGGLCDIHWGLLALIGSLLTSYARAKSETAGVPMETVGVIERAERLLIIIFATLISTIWVNFPSLKISVIILALASNLTVLQRIIYFYRRGSSKKF